MPIKTQNDLPAKEILENENIFVMDEFRAVHQDMRPLQVLILNNMPVKQDTELQLLRALSNTPLQVDVTFMNTKTHVSLNGSLQTILMRSFLLKLENIQRFCQQCFSAQILFFAVSGYFFRILGNHLRTVNDIHDKLIHLFLHLAIWHFISNLPEPLKTCVLWKLSSKAVKVSVF